MQANNDLLYQFSLVATLSHVKENQLVAWSFKRKINGVLTELGHYPVNSTFNFMCETCDYLVSPVYFNGLTGKIEEGSATMIRP